MPSICFNVLSLFHACRILFDQRHRAGKVGASSPKQRVAVLGSHGALIDFWGENASVARAVASSVK